MIKKAQNIRKTPKYKAFMGGWTDLPHNISNGIGFTKDERFSLFYEPFNNNFLQKTWDEARTSCVCTEPESEAGDLVDVQSEEEDGFLQALAGVDKETWLGNK